MLDTFNGLPVHPLVVHAVVVLLPLAILGTVAIAAYRPWRLRYGVLVAAVAVVATALIPVATSSGEELEKHVGDPGRHAQLGDQLIWFALPMLVLLLALVYLERTGGSLRGTETEAGGSGGAGEPRTRSGLSVVTAVAVLAVVAAVAAGVQVYRVGDSGARAAWAGKVAAHQ